MASIVIRGLDDGIKERLRRRAAERGRSMEAEARAIVTEAVAPPRSTEGLGLRLHRRFMEATGGHGVELETPPRTDQARAADFSGPGFDIEDDAGR